MLSTLSRSMRSLLEVWVWRAPNGCWELIPGKATAVAMGWAETMRVTQGSSPLGCSVRVWKRCQAAEEGWGATLGQRTSPQAHSQELWLGCRRGAGLVHFQRNQICFSNFQTERRVHFSLWRTT